MLEISIDEQVELLMQGTEYGDDGLKSAMGEELRQRLKLAEEEGRSLRVYCGFDPRTSDLHIGHTVSICINYRNRVDHLLGVAASIIVCVVSSYGKVVGNSIFQARNRILGGVAHIHTL